MVFGSSDEKCRVELPGRVIDRPIASRNEGIGGPFVLRKHSSILLVSCVTLVLAMPLTPMFAEEAAGDDVQSRSPRIVNIINFIRQCEPRIDWITEDQYNYVREMIKMFEHIKAGVGKSEGFAEEDTPF